MEQNKQESVSCFSSGFRYDRNDNLFVAEKTQVESVLPQLVWVITDKCKCRCPFCFETKTNSEFDISLLDEYLQLFSLLKVQKIDLSGGETVNYPYLPVVCDALFNRGISFTISTSGYISNNLEWLVCNQHRFSRIMISINGYDKESIDYLNGCKGVFEAQSQLIEMLTVSNLRINTVVNQTLVDMDKMDSLIGLIKKIKPREWCLIQPHPENKKSTYDRYDVTEEEFLTVLERTTSVLKDTGINVLSRNNANYNGYWVLNAKGKLFHHSMRSYPSKEYVFRIANEEEIVSKIKKSRLWVATKGTQENT